jgi:hypothetical protein
VDELISQARDHSGYDFISVTDHSHDLTEQEFTAIQKAVKPYDQAPFVVLFGQEFSNYEPDNMTIVQGYPVTIPAQRHKEYKNVFNEIHHYSKLHSDQYIYGEFNHPRNFETDYGMQSSFAGDVDAFIKTLDPVVQLIALDSGSFNWYGEVESPDTLPEKLHRHSDIEDIKYWITYLLHGMHIGPKLDTNYHTKFPGQLMAARTAVWVNGPFNRKNLAEALSLRQTYVTEDLNLKIYAQVNDNHLPGVILSNQTNQHFKLNLNLEDPDEPNARYALEIHYGVPGEQKLSPIPPEYIQHADKNTFRFSHPISKSKRQFFIVKVEQFSNDPVNGSTSATSWLSPIWFE